MTLTFAHACTFLRRLCRKNSLSTTWHFHSWWDSLMYTFDLHWYGLHFHLHMQRLLLTCRPSHHLYISQPILVFFLAFLRPDFGTWERQSLSTWENQPDWSCSYMASSLLTFLVVLTCHPHLSHALFVLFLANRPGFGTWERQSLSRWEKPARQKECCPVRFTSFSVRSATH
jgi:hypothetical protein